MQAKIRELYKASQEAQQAAAAMLPNRLNNYSGMPQSASQQQYPMASMMNAYNAAAVAAAALGGRNPYTSGSGSPYAAGTTAASTAGMHHFGTTYPGTLATSGQYQQQQQRVHHQQPVAAGPAVAINPDIKFVKLPFYDNHAELLKPASLLSTSTNNRFQEAHFQFFLNPSQATDIASNRDISVGVQTDYLYQIQLRFCQLSLEPGKEMTDEFPPSICVHVNGKMAQLPNPIPTNKPGVEPKRPPKPVNITQLCKLSPILPNNINIKWSAEYGKGWVVGVWLVMKLNSSDLLDRLKKKGARNPDFTKGLIRDKLNDDDEVATTSLKAYVACPLGKMRMQVRAYVHSECEQYVNCIVVLEKCSCSRSHVGRQHAATCNALTRACFYR